MSISSSSAGGGVRGGTSGSGGFTLLEVLIAFTILGLALPALFGAFGDGLALVDRGGRGAVLLTHAENRLALVGAEIALRPGVEEGEGADHAWRVEIVEVDRVAGPVAAITPLVLFRVLISVTDASGAQRTLVTHRAGPPP